MYSLYPVPVHIEIMRSTLKVPYRSMISVDILLIKYIILTQTTFQSCRQTDAKLKCPLETRQQILHAQAASCMQSRQFFANTLPEQLFELKNEDTIKKSENLRGTCPCYGLSINTMYGQIQSRETVPLNYFLVYYDRVLRTQT